MTLATTTVTWRGVTLDGTGGDYSLESLEGWDDLPPVRTRFVARPGAHGTFDDVPEGEGRTVLVAGKVRDATDRDTLLAGLVEAFYLADVGSEIEDLTVVHGGRTLLARARLTRFKVSPLAWGLGVFGYAAEWYCPDPRRLGAEKTATVGLSSSSGGLSWPVSWPVTWGATVTGGTATVVNTGIYNADATLRIDGPVDTPRITHAGQGKTLTFPVELTAGQYLEVDFDARSARINGAVARTVAGQWPTVAPGTNVFRTGAAAYEASALWTFTWRDAW
jgi:hypothetical protein